MMVLAPESAAFRVTQSQFRSAATARWGAHLAFTEPEAEHDPIGVTATVTRPDEQPFLVHHLRTDDMLTIHGNGDQIVEVAAWAIATFPPAGPGEVWLTDQARVGHVRLLPGITPAEVLDAWE